MYELRGENCRGEIYASGENCRVDEKGFWGESSFRFCRIRMQSFWQQKKGLRWMIWLIWIGFWLVANRVLKGYKGYWVERLVWVYAHWVFERKNSYDESLELRVVEIGCECIFGPEDQFDLSTLRKVWSWSFQSDWNGYKNWTKVLERFGWFLMIRASKRIF